MRSRKVWNTSPIRSCTLDRHYERRPCPPLAFEGVTYPDAEPAPGGRGRDGAQDACRACQGVPGPPGMSFTTWPINISEGPKRAAVTFDGTHYIIITGNWWAGLWRCVEP
jgi:hypothetical protein